VFLIGSSPNPSASAVRTEVCPQQHPRCKTHPYQAEQCAMAMTCQATTSPLLALTVLCSAPLFVLVHSISPPAPLTAQDPLPQLEDQFAMKGALERSAIPLFFYPISSFSSEIDCSHNLLEGLAFKHNYHNKTAQAIVRISAAQQACTDGKWY